MSMVSSSRNARVLTIAAVVVLGAVTLLVAGSAQAQSADDRMVIDTTSASPTVPFKVFDAYPTKLFDIDGDGQLEIIAQNDNQWVYVFDSKTGELLFETETKLPANWGARSINGPEVAVVSHEGQTRLIIANSAAVITSFRFDAEASSPGDLHFIKQWERRLDDCHSNPGMDAKPVLADLTADGQFEILGATEEQGLYALRLDGSLLWRNCLAGGNAAPVTADLDQDGALDVVHVSDGGVVAALNGQNGAWKWGYSIRSEFDIGSASIPVAAGVGQLDGIGGPDIVVGARDSHDAENFDNNNALLLALSSQGKVLWSFQDPDGNPLTYTQPVIVDTDGDGTNEVYWGDWNTMGHKPPPPDSPDAWAVTGPANFYRLNPDGTVVWKQSIPTWWSNKDLAIADVTGDGVQDVLVNGPSSSGDGIWYLDTRDGSMQKFVSSYPWKVQRGPVVADLWGTGTTQWVIPASAGSSTVSGGAIIVYDTGVPYDAVWPHRATPVLAPKPAEPTEPTEPSGSFNATFQIKAPNAWWQELTVKPDTPRTITAADVRINDGSWTPMKKSSWGAWTSSYNAPAGSKVEFRATDAGGARSVSAPFTWLDGTLSQRNADAASEPEPSEPEPSEPEPAPFTATFDIPSGVNEWWIETRVGSTRIITSVETRVNGGSWIQLSKTSWGTWAKSVYAAEGSTVQFRATSSDGDTALSPKFSWLQGEKAPATGFSATFEPSPNIGRWWVEVTVRANEPLTEVAATVNGGEAVTLSKTSWGSWAKSFHVPEGSEVRFQAIDGATVTSKVFVWP